MLTNEELILIKKKMKETHTFGATLAQQFGVTKQAINFVLNQIGTSKPLESKIRKWYDEQK